MIRAIEFTDRAEFTRKKVPGSFWLDQPNSDGVSAFWFVCPCGCGVPQRIVVGNNFKPETGAPSWRWNGSRSEPTLEPSVNHEGHWHGWLRDGYWENVG